MTPAYETRHDARETLPVHRHAMGYAALVLDGGYEEVCADGRFACGPGTLVIHPAWHTHGDEFGCGGAVVLNLPDIAADSLSVIRISNPQSLEKLAREHPGLAAEAVREEAETVAPIAPARWLVKLTRLLCECPDVAVDKIAEQCGVSPEHAARACKSWFGFGPVQLRKEKRLQLAIKLLRDGANPAVAALEAGFSDQPHLTRLLKRATGHTPARFPTS